MRGLHRSVDEHDDDEENCDVQDKSLTEERGLGRTKSHAAAFNDYIAPVARSPT